MPEELVGEVELTQQHWYLYWELLIGWPSTDAVGLREEIQVDAEDEGFLPVVHRCSCTPAEQGVEAPRIRSNDNSNHNTAVYNGFGEDYTNAREGQEVEEDARGERDFPGGDAPLGERGTTAIRWERSWRKPGADQLPSLAASSRHVVD